MTGLLKKAFLLIFVVLLWSACSENTEVEIINMDEVLPQSAGNYDYDEDTLENAQVELSPTQKKLIQNFPGLNFEEENKLRKRKMLFMPDRLGYTKKEESYFIKDSVSFHYLSWKFADSVKTISAFYNWLDCFGAQCKSIRINEETNGSKEAFIIWVSDSQIIYLGSEKNINRAQWENVLFSTDNTEWNFKIQQAKRGRITWLFSPSE
ncbi:hypothetical protein [Brumimicrobium oceani]|uniref:Lipoprotein n=1 Tax=Brumimicrobium oceani TaxID=2100725 RepID=A0A2U2XGC0_9FLAO|nr:hypothetical protein [Brumimicrobium oceani]PWH86835.1 hypothetical protein DIT68_00810 [Brumimicrobium oceani]